MKSKGDVPRTIDVRSLLELDALVGQYLTGETPVMHWVNSHTELVFDSVEEAVEAVNDPFYRQFVPRDAPTTAVLTEVREFRPYSSDLTIAWELVEHLSHTLEPLVVRRAGDKWEGAFGSREFISGPTAAIVICLAGLRSRGVEVRLLLENPPSPSAAGLPGAEVKSLYSRP
jgi:hypothetical protein